MYNLCKIQMVISLLYIILQFTVFSRYELIFPINLSEYVEHFCCEQYV